MTQLRDLPVGFWVMEQRPIELPAEGKRVRGKEGSGWARGQAVRPPGLPAEDAGAVSPPTLWRGPFISCRAAAIASTLVQSREMGLEDPPQVAWELIDENTWTGATLAPLSWHPWVSDIQGNSSAFSRSLLAQGRESALGWTPVTRQASSLLEPLLWPESEALRRP